jgi:WD40 repeat protein
VLLDYQGRLLFCDLDQMQPLGPPQDAHPDPTEEYWSEQAFSPDGTLLVTAGSPDQSLKVWDVATRQLRATIPLPDIGWVQDLSYSPDGQLVLVAADHGVVAWHPGDTDATVFVATPAEFTISVKIDPTGRLVAIGMEKGSQVLDVATKRVVADNLRPTDTVVQTAAWSPDGHLLALGGQVGNVQVWDTSSWQPLGEVGGLEGWVYPLVFSPDSHLLLAGGIQKDAAVNVWTLDPSVWIQTACQLVGRNLSHEEWSQYVGNRPYQEVCPGMPIPATAAATPLPAVIPASPLAATPDV